MIRILASLFLCAPAVGQLTPTSLMLGNPLDPSAVNADLVVFEVEIKAIEGIWIEPNPSQAQSWAYDMNAQWMSLLADQQPSLQAAKWSLPNVYAVNSWAINFSGTAPQYLPRGRYLMAMADDTLETGRPPSPVIPRTTASVFANQDLEISNARYAINTNVNAVLELPPFANHSLQPCDLVGFFPYSTLPGTPPAAIAWIAGGLTSTCTGTQGNFGGQSTGFLGSCSRWILDNISQSSSVQSPVHLRAFRQDLFLATGTPLPAAVGGVCAIAIEPSAGMVAPIDVDLSLALPSLFSNGGFLRIAPPALMTMSLLNSNNLDLVLAAPNDPLLSGARLLMQVGVVQVDGEMSLTDLYGLRFR
jgi:hypothetical protein